MNGVCGDDGHRAQTAVLGFGLLLVLAAFGITTVLLVGNAGLSDVQESAQLEQAEIAFTQLDSQASTVALGGSDAQRVGLGSVGESGAVGVEATGTIVVETQDGTTYLDQTMGTVVYRHQSGDVVAYQGGGVWRGTGRQSTMVSPPEFHYRDGTLTLPLVVANPTAQGGKGDRLQLSNTGRRAQLAPGAIENQVVTIRITSDYYAAWAQYFRERIDGVTVEVDHDTNTVEITLAELDIDGDYSTGVVAQGDVVIGNGNAEVDSEVSTSGSVTVSNSGSLECDAGSGVADCATQAASLDHTSLDLVLETLIDQSKTEDPSANVGDGGTLTAGSYYSDGFLLDGETLTMDLSGGNVTLFVDGNVGLSNGEIQVVNGAGTDHYAKIYSSGDFAMAKGQSKVTVDSGNATRFQLYGSSEMHFGMGQSNDPGFVGTVYAPRDEPAEGSNAAVEEYGLSSVSCAGVDMCVGTGSGTFHGAIVGGPLTAAQSTRIEYAPELQYVDPSLPDGAILPPPLTFLHISVNRMDVAGAPGSGSVGLPDPVLHARLSVSAQGTDSYRLHATGSTPKQYVDRFEWDYDDDGTVDETTTASNVTIECGTDVGASDCSSLPDAASVTVVNDEFGLSDTDSDSYPPSGGGDTDDGGDGGDPGTEQDPEGSITSTQPDKGNKYEVEYEVSDANGNLDEVTIAVEYTDHKGNAETASASRGVSGSSDSGTVRFDLGNHNSVDRVTLTVTDDTGREGTDTENYPS